LIIPNAAWDVMQLGLSHAAVGSVIQEQDVVGDKNKRIFLG
jgi:hypothetical protein